MKPAFHPSLVNHPLGDPGLLIQFLYQKRALLFDLGDISRLPSSTLLKVSHVFVSHTHIDHFYGFDRLLRVVFGRDKTITLFGPKDFLSNVEGKLRGFTWNLVDRYNESITLDVVEVHPNRLLKASFRAIDKFKPSQETESPFEKGVLLSEPEFSIETAILEHRVPCLGFAFRENFHINIRKDRLNELGYPPGPWLNELKEAIYKGETDSFIIRVPKLLRGKEFNEISLGNLKEQLVLISPGQKISYIVDTVYNEANKKRIVDLVRDSDVFFCESPFLAEEEERGRDRCHLTSRQAGLLGREAGVKRLEVFHFSQKHSTRTDQLYQEAEDAFKGKETSVP